MHSVASSIASHPRNGREYRIGGGAYEISALLGFSHVRGDSTAILNVQRSRALLPAPDAESYTDFIENFSDGARYFTFNKTAESTGSVESRLASRPRLERMMRQAWNF